MKFMYAVLLLLLVSSQSKTYSFENSENLFEVSSLNNEKDEPFRSCPTGNTGIVGYYPLVDHNLQIQLIPLTQAEYFEFLCAHGKDPRF